MATVYGNSRLYRQTFLDSGNVYSVYLIHRFLREHARYPGVTRRQMSLSRFSRWCEYEMWQSDDGRFRWSINDLVRARSTNGDEDVPPVYDDRRARATFDAHLRAIDRADLRFPIIVVRDAFDNLKVIDGNHRIAKAKSRGNTSIAAVIVDNRNIIARAQLGRESRAIYDMIKQMRRRDFDALYERKFQEGE